jgi:hypothetical protein
MVSDHGRDGLKPIQGGVAEIRSPAGHSEGPWSSFSRRAAPVARDRAPTDAFVPQAERQLNRHRPQTCLRSCKQLPSRAHRQRTRSWCSRREGPATVRRRAGTPRSDANLPRTFRRADPPHHQRHRDSFLCSYACLNAVRPRSD